jgi:hypothetical protein
MTKVPDISTCDEPAELTGVPLETADIVRRSVDHAEAAFERASEVAHSSVQVFDAAASALKANATEVQLKAIEMAQANTNALFALARRFLAVRDPTDVVRIQQRFVAEQMQNFARQTGEVQALAVKLVSGAAKPRPDGTPQPLTRTPVG